MGLAAFGTPDPALTEALEAMLTIDKGRPQLGSDDAIARAVQAAAAYRRNVDDPIEKGADLAASGQAAYARLVDQMLAACVPLGETKLILTGGCALNSSYNGTIQGRFGFERVHVPSAPADDGNAIGAALLAWRQDHPTAAMPFARTSPFLGTAIPRRAIDLAAQAQGLASVTQSAQPAALLAKRLAAGSIIGVMRGAAEFGPRALGHRSILADPRPRDMKERINNRVKGREPYRPFAPVIAATRTNQWFDRAQPSPYMGFTLPWQAEQRDRVPAVVHHDGTGRLQTVDEKSNPWMAELLSAFERETGVPIVLNTSFNVMGKPIVHTVQDAMAVLATTGLDGVLLDDVLIEKSIPSAAPAR
jgi:carbamoyltransferase